MRLLRDLKRKVFGNPTAPVQDNPSIDTATIEEPELTFDNPLIDYPFNVIADFFTYVGSFMPVIKELSLHRVRSTVTEAELQNIKNILPVLGAHLLSSGLCYLLLRHQTEQNAEDESALQGTFILGGLITLGTIQQLSNIIQWGAFAYDNTVGMKYNLKMVVERQFSTFNLSRTRPETIEATCTKDCGTLRAAAHGNFLKSAHYYTNFMAISLANRYIFSLLEPIPYVGFYLSTYFYIMAEGRYLLDLGTTYCKEHRTLKPETTLATGLWSYGTRSLLQCALLNLGIPSHTRAIIQEIPLIYFTALVLHINFPTIAKKRPKRLAMKNTSKANKMLYTMGSHIANPFRAYEEAVEWILDVQLIGFSAQFGKLFQGEEETDWHHIQKKLTTFINHHRVKQAQTWLLPEFLHSCDNFANHPPIREQWALTRNKLMGYLEKIFAAQHSHIGSLLISHPKKSAKIFQLLLGIKASTAEEIIRMLGDESTTKILKELYWWLGTHGVHQSTGLTGLPVLPAASDQVEKLSEARISRRSFAQSLKIPADKTANPNPETKKMLMANPPANTIPAEKTVIDNAPNQPVVDTSISGETAQKKIVDDAASMALVIQTLESQPCAPIPAFAGVAPPTETTAIISQTGNPAPSLTPVNLADTVITDAVTTSKQNNLTSAPVAITKPLTSSNASFFSQRHTRQQTGISLKDFTRKASAGSAQKPKPADSINPDSNNFFRDESAIPTKPFATAHSLTQ